jgi:hypothetical protein
MPVVTSSDGVCSATVTIAPSWAGRRDAISYVIRIKGVTPPLIPIVIELKQGIVWSGESRPDGDASA